MTRKLKILFMTENFSDNVCIRHLYELERAIGRIAACRWAGPGHMRYREGESLDATVKRVMPRADWVIYYDFGLTKRGIEIDIPEKTYGRKYNVAAYIGDIQRRPQEYLEHLNTCGWDALLMAYIRTGQQITWIIKKRGGGPPKRVLEELPLNHYVRGLRIPFLHVPPSINPEMFKPLDVPREYDVTMIGALHNIAYPLRKVIWDELPEYAEDMGWNALIRKGPIGPSLDRNISDLIDEHFVGERYAEALARSKVFIFGTSIFKYVLFKFPEAMACRTLVMSDAPLSARQYHLFPDRNFVEIDEENWKEKLKYYLEHDDEREKIAQRGYETVMEHHTVDIRARQVVDFLESIR